MLKLQGELKQARDEAAQARDESERLRKALDRASSAKARAEERSRKVRRQPGPDSLLARLRGLFEGATKEELERAQREIVRLNQQLSRVQPQRPGRR